MDWIGTESAKVEFKPGGPMVVIGERLNPTGNKRYADALRRHDYETIVSQARKQAESGADVIDVNAGLPGLDEVETLAAVVKAIQSELDVPLCLDSSNSRAIEKALSVLHGRALVNSVNGEERSRNEILPLVRDYDSMVVALCLDQRGIKYDVSSRVEIAESILESCAKMGIGADRVLVDPLVLTVGSNPMAGRAFLDTLEELGRKLRVRTVAGISNVSFGLPERDQLNMNLLAMAIAYGLTACIADPLKAGIVDVVRSSDMLAGRKGATRRFLSFVRERRRE